MSPIRAKQGLVVYYALIRALQNTRLSQFFLFGLLDGNLAISNHFDKYIRIYTDIYFRIILFYQKYLFSDKKKIYIYIQGELRETDVFNEDKTLRIF